jgi:hypothetical protein
MHHSQGFSYGDYCAVEPLPFLDDAGVIEFAPMLVENYSGCNARSFA